MKENDGPLKGDCCVCVCVSVFVCVRARLGALDPLLLNIVVDGRAAGEPLYNSQFLSVCEVTLSLILEKIVTVISSLWRHLDSSGPCPPASFPLEKTQ